MQLNKFQKQALRDVLYYLHEEGEHYEECLESGLDCSNHIYISIEILDKAVIEEDLRELIKFRSSASLEDFFED